MDLVVITAALPRTDFDWPARPSLAAQVVLPGVNLLPRLAADLDDVLGQEDCRFGTKNDQEGVAPCLTWCSCC